MLCVALDFEGMLSFERTTQEDMMAAAFEAAISDFTYFKMEMRMEVQQARMFERFQDAVSLVQVSKRLRGLAWRFHSLCP